MNNRIVIHDIDDFRGSPEELSRLFQDDNFNERLDQEFARKEPGLLRGALDKIASFFK